MHYSSGLWTDNAPSIPERRNKEENGSSSVTKPIKTWCFNRSFAVVFLLAQVSCQLQACRGDLGIPEWLRKSYFSFFFPDMTYFCLGWSLHSASEHRLLAAEVYVKQDWLVKAKNKSKHLYICKEPLCLVCSALAIWLPFQAFLCKKEDQFFFFPPPSKIIFFTAWKAIMCNEGPRCIPSMLGGLMPRSRRYQDLLQTE